MKKFLLLVIAVISITQTFAISGAETGDGYYLPPIPSAPGGTSVGGGSSALKDFDYTGPGGTNWTHSLSNQRSSDADGLFRMKISHTNEAITPKTISGTFTGNFNWLKNNYANCPTKSLDNPKTPGYSFTRYFKFNPEITVENGTKRQVYLMFCYGGNNTVRIYHRVQNQGKWTKDQAIFHGSMHVEPAGGEVTNSQASQSNGETTELSLPFSSDTICNSKKESNNTKYPSYKRSTCFENRGKFYYYICDKGSNDCSASSGDEGSTRGDLTVNSTGTSMTQNNMLSGLDESLIKKLKLISVKFEALSIKDLNAVLTRLNRLSEKFKDSALITKIINYLEFDIKRIIDTKTKDADVDNFFCEFTGDCNVDTTVTVNVDPAVNDTCKIKDSGVDLKMYGCNKGDYETVFRRSDKACFVGQAKAPLKGEWIKNGSTFSFGGNNQVAAQTLNCTDGIFYKKVVVDTVVSDPAVNDTCKIKDSGVDLKMYGCNKGDYETVFRRSDKACFVGQAKAPLKGEWIKNGSTFSFGGNNQVAAQTLNCTDGIFYKKVVVDTVVSDPAVNDTCKIKDSGVDLKMYGCNKGDYETVFRRSDKACFVGQAKAPLKGEWIKNGSTFSFGGNNQVAAQTLNCTDGIFYKKVVVDTVVSDPAANDTCKIKDSGVDLKMYGCNKGDYETVFRRSDKACFVGQAKAPLKGEWIKNGSTFSFGGNNQVAAQTLNCTDGIFYKKSSGTSVGGGQHSTCTLNRGSFIHNDYMYYTYGEGDYCKTQVKASTSNLTRKIENGLVEYKAIPKGMINKGNCGYGLEKGDYKIGSNSAGGIYSNGSGYYCKKTSVPSTATVRYSIPTTMVGGKVCGVNPRIANSCTGGVKYTNNYIDPISTNPAASDTCKIRDTGVDLKMYGCNKGDYETVFRRSDKACFVGDAKAPLKGEWIKNGSTFSFGGNTQVASQTLNCTNGTFYKKSSGTSVGGGQHSSSATNVYKKGIFKVNTGVFYSNGRDAYCWYDNYENYIKLTTKDYRDARIEYDKKPTMRYDGVCK